MEEAILKLLEAADRSTIVPLVVSLVVIFAVKLIYGYHRSSYADRKDFLETFESEKVSNELWLSVAIRNLYGDYLPLWVIKKLLETEEPGRALRDVARVWELVEVEQATKQVRWCKPWHRTERRRCIVKWLFRAFAFLALMIAVVIARALADSHLESALIIIGWVMVPLIAGLALALAERADAIAHGAKALKQWLDVP